MRVFATLLLCLVGFMGQAEAHSRHSHHGHHIRIVKAEGWNNDRWSHADFFGSPASMPSTVWPVEPRYREARTHEYGGLTRAKLGDGQIITVASAYADRFVGFFNALLAREGHLPRIGCYSPTGHMRNSLHHWGGACDVGQTARNVAARMMYHVTALAARFGLTDGAMWHNPDAGHVDVSGLVGSGRHYASHRRRHYARL